MAEIINLNAERAKTLLAEWAEAMESGQLAVAVEKSQELTTFHQEADPSFWAAFAEELITQPRLAALPGVQAELSVYGRTNEQAARYILPIVEFYTIRLKLLKVNSRGNITVQKVFRIINTIHELVENNLFLIGDIIPVLAYLSTMNESQEADMVKAILQTSNRSIDEIIAKLVNEAGIPNPLGNIKKNETLRTRYSIAFKKILAAYTPTTDPSIFKIAAEVALPEDENNIEG